MLSRGRRGPGRGPAPRTLRAPARFDPRAGGREVKNLGDGLMVAFDGVTDALACAVRCSSGSTSATGRGRAACGSRRRSHGEADVEDDDYFGVPVVEAARLCARADGDQILTTELVRTLAGFRGGLEFEALGALELKGLDEPVATSRGVWSSGRPRRGVDSVAAASRPSSPAAIRRSGRGTRPARRPRESGRERRTAGRVGVG